MAYITREEISNIRKKLKKEFPNIKFSVRGKNHSTVDVAIMESDIEFSDILKGRDYVQLNPYYADEHYPEYKDLFSKITEIMKSQNWYDKSDTMTDYFDTAYYMHLEIGRWDKPYVCRCKKVA
jgi:hypothetical protein